MNPGLLTPTSPHIVCYKCLIRITMFSRCHNFCHNFFGHPWHWEPVRGPKTSGRPQKMVQNFGQPNFSWEKLWRGVFGCIFTSWVRIWSQIAKIFIPSQDIKLVDFACPQLYPRQMPRRLCIPNFMGVSPKKCRMSLGVLCYAVFLSWHCGDVCCHWSQCTTL